MDHKTELKLTQANGDRVALAIDFGKMHESWRIRCMEYGARRLVNDTYSGEKGDEKVALCKAMLDEMHNGKPMAVKERKAPTTQGKVDAVRKLARDLATTDLVAVFTSNAATLGKDEKAWALHEVTAKYFRTTEKGSIRFDFGAVDTYITNAKTRAKDPKDFLRDAQAQLAAAGAVASNVDLADLGL